LRTPIRRLEGITYWVIESPEAISDFINNEIRREWEADAKSEGRDPKDDPWLKTLSKRRWALKTVRMDQINLDPRIMNYRMPRADTFSWTALPNAAMNSE